MKKLLGFSSLLLAALVYGSFGVWVKLLSAHMSIYQQVVLRNAFAFILAFLIILVMREWTQVSWHKIKKSSLIFFTFLVPIDVILYNVSILSTKIALATFAFYIGTILTGWVVGVVSYKEKLKLRSGCR
jgi:drug/metabolite transporter (DMT)-like permease